MASGGPPLHRYCTPFLPTHEGGGLCPSSPHPLPSVSLWTPRLQDALFFVPWLHIPSFPPFPFSPSPPSIFPSYSSFALIVCDSFVFAHVLVWLWLFFFFFFFFFFCVQILEFLYRSIPDIYFSQGLSIGLVCLLLELLGIWMGFGQSSEIRSLQSLYALVGAKGWSFGGEIWRGHDLATSGWRWPLPLSSLAALERCARRWLADLARCAQHLGCLLLD